jgi:hypothetical protein
MRQLSCGGSNRGRAAFLADLLTRITQVAACVIKVSVADVRVMSRFREERQQIATCHTLRRARY